jgi:hypothetical protein
MLFDVPRIQPLTEDQKAAIVQHARQDTPVLRIAGELRLPLPLALQHLELKGLRHRPFIDRNRPERWDWQ